MNVWEALVYMMDGAIMKLTSIHATVQAQVGKAVNVNLVRNTFFVYFNHIIKVRL